ncbi:MAG: hypothetical protein MUO21_07555, partial [Nitrososphaeraceae archaeon]|nr:hypothetical protein [Nitrososphaeraceae archaeon]
YLPIAIGSAVGLGLCLISVTTMEGIIKRPNIEGELVLTSENLIEYAKLPFNKEKQEVAWGTVPDIDLLDRFKLLSMNWVAMAGTGAAVGAGLTLMLV